MVMVNTFNHSHNILLMMLIFMMLDQIFFSSQVKQNVIISNKHGMYGLPFELPNDLRHIILGN